MNNNVTEKEIYSNKFYNYYIDDNYTLYDIQEFYYPYFKVKCNCIFREKNKISIVEEKILEAIKCGIKDFQSLENFLALDKEIFEVIASKLHTEGLFIIEPLLILTEIGKKILKDGAQLNSVESEEDVILDAITGDTSSGYFEDEKKNTSKNINSLKIQVPYPKNETLDIIINDKALQTILFEEIKKKEQKKNKNNEKEIYEIKEIAERPWKFHKKYFALFFKNIENPRKILIIKDGNPDDDMTDRINTLEKEGKNLFDFPIPILKAHQNLLKQKSIYEYAEINNLDNGTQLSVYEHPKFFEYALRYSKKEVIIITPWIKWEVIKEKKDDIEDALQRGVTISFLYGMGKKDDIDKKSNIFFETLKKEYDNKMIFSTNHDINNHSKILICDREWMITTSFNWGSFKGDPSKKERKETGSFINKINEIEKIIHEYYDSLHN